MASKERTIPSLESIETVVDTDLHINENVAEDLFPYLPDPFDKMLNVSPEETSYVTGQVIPSAGYVGSTDYGTAKRTPVRTEDDVLGAMDLLDTDQVILTAGTGLRLGMVHHEELSAALATANNEFMLDTLLNPRKGVYGAAVISPQRPVEAAEEIDRRADEDGIVGVLIPSGGVTPPLGRERYFPIYEAAEDAGLPVMFHGAGTGVMSSFPSQWRGTKRYIDVHVTGHPADHMFHLSTLLTNGVPVRFPDLKFVFQESGIGWIPFFMHRYDNEYSEKRQDAPLLEKAPSEYIRDQFYFSSQPVEGADNPTYVAEIIRMFGGEDRLMFSSDYPHSDFDNSDYLLNSLATEFSTETIENIYGKTARSVFAF